MNSISSSLYRFIQWNRMCSWPRLEMQSHLFSPTLNFARKFRNLTGKNDPNDQNMLPGVEVSYKMQYIIHAIYSMDHTVWSLWRTELTRYFCWRMLFGALHLTSRITYIRYKNRYLTVKYIDVKIDILGFDILRNIISGENDTDTFLAKQKFYFAGVIIRL